MSAQADPMPDAYRKVFWFIRRRVKSVEDAEDLTQEVFANASARLQEELSAPPTLAWLYTVAQRRIADEARRLRRSDSVSLESVLDPAAPANDYGDGVARTLDRGLATMPESQRRVVVGRLLQGRSFAELARDLSTTEEACRMRFARALQHLREEFEKEGLRP